MNECCFTASLDNHFTDDFNRKLSILNLWFCLTKILGFPRFIRHWIHSILFNYISCPKKIEGAVDNFAEHDDLNQCDQFDMKNSPSTQIRVTILHEGT